MANWHLRRVCITDLMNKIQQLEWRIPFYHTRANVMGFSSQLILLYWMFIGTYKGASQAIGKRDCSEANKQSVFYGAGS
jgi:hypothetical protein